MAWSLSTTHCGSPPSFPLGLGPMGALDLILLDQAKPGLSRFCFAKRLYAASAAARLWRVGMADAPFPQEVFEMDWYPLYNSLRIAAIAPIGPWPNGSPLI